MKYINDQQIINDAAQMLLEKHMDWSGSHESMPSRDLGNVRGFMVEAYLDANFTPESWNNASSEMKASVDEHLHGLCNAAKWKADEKWQAAMALLGF